jgi:hypothetical protein
MSVRVVVVQLKARTAKIVQELKFPSDDRAWAACRSIADQLGSDFHVEVVGGQPRRPVGGIVPKIISQNVEKKVDINPWTGYSYNRN